MKKETKKLPINSASKLRARKPLFKQLRIGMFGVASGMHFRNNRAFIFVLLNQIELKRIAKTLQNFVHEEFPKDVEYIKAIDVVVKKLEKKTHAVQITEEVVLGTTSITFDHVTGKEIAFKEDK